MCSLFLRRGFSVRRAVLVNFLRLPRYAISAQLSATRCLYYYLPLGEKVARRKSWLSIHLNFYFKITEKSSSLTIRRKPYAK